MNKKLLIFIAAILPIGTSFNAIAAVRASNQTRSYPGSYNPAPMMQNNTIAIDKITENNAENLPVRVADKNLADLIARGDNTAITNLTNLESCARIYPGGNFAWDTPTAGMKIGAAQTCVAVVEMRVIKGTTDIVVARANVAAGDSINCNIGDFPDATYTNDTASVLFPSDNAPTMDDVIKIMNEEQKKNAGFKIAAGVVVGGLSGNALGKNEIGDSSVIGGGAGKAQGTVIGALSGGALMAGNSYAGKLGGDVILSTGVNAAMGGVVGNMAGSGASVLRVEKCEIDGRDTECLWGVLEKKEPINLTEFAVFYNVSDPATILCKIKKDEFTECVDTRLIGLEFTDDGYKSLEEMLSDTNLTKIKKQFSYDINTKKILEFGVAGTTGKYIRATSAGRPKSAIAAMIPDFRDKMFGMKMSDWYKWRVQNGGYYNSKIKARNSKGEAGNLPAPKDGDAAWDIQDFYPLTMDANDGAIIDINNKARLKGTMIGAGAGGALGAFTAYQGASDEIDARWLSSVREYKDSLQKIYCATGTRFISQYNDIVVIPNME